jgi:predicted 3-demethylubiquinone-9 3-methyltransferase (glyoxalase superfamily)
MAAQKITPFLWFDHQAEEAAGFYVTLLPNSRILTVARYGASGPGPEGSVMTIAFELDGQKFIALNGGSHYAFTPAVSFLINCTTQDEVDELWRKLAEGGQELRCGWVTDRYGLSWQVVPTVLPELLTGRDPQKAQRVMQAMLHMKKIDIAALQRAYDSR